MSKPFFCVEILGEPAFHKSLVQSGWSGKDYHFRYNRPTRSHMRAYRRLEDYLAERIDLHKSANVWPILGNVVPEDQIEAHVFTAPVDEEKAPTGKRKRRMRRKRGVVPESEDAMDGGDEDEADV